MPLACSDYTMKGPHPFAFTIIRADKERKTKTKHQIQNNDKSITSLGKKPVRCKKFKFKSFRCVPLVVFSDRMKNRGIVRIKDHVSGTTAMLEIELKIRSRTFQAAVVGIDEFRTSRVCNFCKEMSLKATKLPSDKCTQSILDCKNCRIL
ncbi:hypothetical protein PHYBLDRAFT_150556 [Phycomyces blakesleeanus NRRL 1555(-)]|uniref:Uncharacterized protein n=1 Tax=Phycomyces blakesleeanus (strain ATCC 8743b / DSM 1359 / FGSC 10004 / NBRC 33097 / NRRL 1555) TaxID=763407 RepID=A0A167KLM6_PHYB8|nr:hypothetical protein PHYBLDRAFT_150556 [Phycomyces blakesleeanus NRRL 1555(-)]OAD68377.1 hypothetical protein PHYBLDRAFT_150556 [Phycomyces blakesleeanus NRRL 1555(-)]|eukprot:XP_018286417.1 hypothetical protein PHYBLDRAFT_150556 [Phycomyces blakesleeanus NRRL 1555(-)]